MPSRVTALDAWAFLLPAVSFVEVTIVGRLIVTEMLLLLMLPWLLNARGRLPLPRWFVLLWAAWLLGQVAADLVVRSSLEDLARGWASIVLTMTNFVAILVLVSTPKRARLFAAGLATGGVLGYLFVPSAYAAVDPWKWAFALPVGLALAATLSGARGARHPWLAVGAFAAFGVANLFLGYRSLGGVSLLASGYLAFGALLGTRAADPGRSLLRAGAAIGMLALALFGTLQLYDAAASSGILGPAAQATYLDQSGAFGVLVGGRSEILASSQAVVDSPILGHGSWAKDFAYVDLLADRLSSLGYEVGAGLSDVGLIPAHSYLLGSWVWAGIFGGLFWLVIAVIAVWLLVNLYAFRIDMTPLLTISAVLLLWNIAFSPYGFSQRILAPYGIALCLLGLRLIRSDQPDDRLARTSSGASRYPVPRPMGLNSARHARRMPGRPPAQSGNGA